MKRLTMRVDTCTEILAILIAMAWADGKLLPREKKGLASAASVMNLTKELRGRLDALLESPPKLGEIIVENIPHADRSFAYVAAAWLASVDEDVAPAETARLAEVQSILGLDDDRALSLRDLAKELGRPHQDAGWAADLMAIFRAIPSRLAPSDEEAIELAFE